MSGGVDSAVAAARAADAGYDVTGVHLALSRNPQTYRSGARGCCTLEDARDARRAADVIGIPFYVWDLAERFHEDVVDDFVAEYAAGGTPGAGCGRGSGSSPVTSSTARPARYSAGTPVPTGTRSASARGSGWTGRRRTGSRGTCWRSRRCPTR